MPLFDNSSNETFEIGSCGISTYLKSQPTAAIVRTNTIIVVVDSFLAVFTIITNSLFIRTYQKTRELQNISNLLLVVLAISDILVGCLAEPLHIVRSAMEIYATHNCVLFSIIRLVMIFCSGMSFLTIIVITKDRYIAIFYPLHYPTMFSKNRIKLVFVACGLLLIALLIARVFLKLSTFFLIICGLSFYTTISASVVYGKILLVARRQKMQIININQKFNMQERRRRLSISLHEIKTTKVMAYVLGAMILCYFPGTGFWIYSYYYGYTMESLYTIVPFLETALFMNSAINPVVYILRSRQIRTAFLRNVRTGSSSTS